MKILHIATGFKLSFPGGITNYVLTLAESQASSGDIVHVLARPEDSTNYPKGVILKEYMPSRVTAFSLENVLNDPSTDAILALINKERYDIVHFQISLDLPLEFLRDFFTIGIPYVVSLHDYSYICPRIYMVDMNSDVCREVDIKKCNTCIGLLDQNFFLLRAARKSGLALPRIPSTAAEHRLEYMSTFLRNAAMLLAVSTRTAEIYINIIPDANYVTEQIGNASVNNVARPKTPSDKIRLTALGTLNKMKGAGILEELLKRVKRPDIEFHFYGRAHDGSDRRLRKLGLICHGSYVPKDIPDIIANTDAGLILPIWEDNGPQVAMEFINNGIPVIGTRRGGLPDIVAESAGYLFDPDSEVELQKAVDWIQSVRKSELSAIASGIRKLITPQQHAERLRELYRTALNED